MVVYDITNRDSFESVEKWMQDARALRDESQALIVMAGNKADLGENEGMRQVPKEEAEAFAREKDIMFFEISALNG